MATAARVFPAQPLKALGTILSLTAVLWIVEFYDQLTKARPEDVQRLTALHDPWREHQVRQAERVIGMEMREEDVRELLHLQALVALLCSSCGAPDDAGPCIH